ncbi:MAG: hypothetical protein EA408_02190 [Marinilabiliales bacterium]|nr:MAG: hypothetical protein EA408_02190 [Marinilabiliales bacterium]
MDQEPYLKRSSASCRLILLLAALTILQTANSQEAHENDTAMARQLLIHRGEVYLSFPATPDEVNMLSNMLSVCSYSGDTAIVNVCSTEFELFLRQGIPFSVILPVVHREEEAERDKDVFFPVKGEWNYYPLYSEYVEMMESWAEEYPDICTLVDAGGTVEGRSILFLVLTGNRKHDHPKPRFMYSSTMHGDETVGYVLMLRLIEYLLRGYPGDPMVERLLDNVEVWINPLANPDGAYHGGDGNTIVSPRRRNANNIDLNRNFPLTGQTEYDTEGRQPETVVMVDLMEETHFLLSANIHTGAEVMNYPWDTWDRRHADDLWFYYICREYVDTAWHYSPDGYMTLLGGVTHGAGWYKINGGRQDFVTYYTGGREVTMEISDTKHPLPGRLPDYWEYNWRSLLGYMEQAMFGLRGRVTDAATGEPVAARIEIPGHDRDSSHVYSCDSTGWYFRLAVEGSYDIVFSAEGYHSRQFDNVQVWNRDTTILNVQLVPVTTYILDRQGEFDASLEIRSSKGGLIHAEALLPGELPVMVGLYDISGRKLKDVYRGYAGPGALIFKIDAGSIRPGIYIIRMDYGDSFLGRRIFITN